LTVTIKPSEAAQKRVADLVKKTGITRHNILLRLINLGLGMVEKDRDNLFTPEAIGSEEEELAPEIQSKIKKKTAGKVA
jgi:hypothetical protein